ncbi:unnamed protein product [Brachionus calyciflorus]|uniref:UPAR/Ly6 domain-containing protein n=1 Tax=Brachionus calyciflorus TaxID=104777 RepID=A0A813YCU7_9BILA|nr:unnamed protein product [Brachionus calyciflorus]
MLSLKISIIILSICVFKSWSLPCYTCTDCNNLTTTVPTNVTVIDCLGPDAQCSTNVFKVGSTDFVTKSCTNFCSPSFYQFPNMNAVFVSTCCQQPLCNE